MEYESDLARLQFTTDTKRIARVNWELPAWKWPWQRASFANEVKWP
jgi:hypothetical protein